MIWSTITQKDLELSTDKTDLPYQYSDGITLKFMKDTKYNGYAVVPYVGVCDTELISCVDKFERLQALTMNVDGTFKVSNKVMFNSGYLYVAFDLVSSNEIIHVGNVIYKINASIGNATVLPEDDLTWQEVVKSFMEEYERINFTEKINALISTAEEQQKNVTSLQTSVNSAIKTLNALLNSMQDKLSNGDFVPNITLGNVSIGVPNVSFRGTGKDVIVDFTMPEFAGIEEYDKVIRDYIFEVGTDYYAKVESDEYSGHTYNSGVDLLKIDGAYSQETTNGFQLFDASKLPTKSQGGATITNNGDGSFTISGSGVASSQINFYYDFTHEETLKLLKVGELILNCGIKTFPYCYIQLRNSNGILFGLSNSSDSITKNSVTNVMLEDSSSFLRIGFINDAIQPTIIGTIKPMLYQDGDGTWEPFTGGIASPNPEYPQEPKFVGDYNEDTQKYDIDFMTSGKNLFNINGNVNVDGYSKEQKTTNTVENGVLTCNVNSATAHGVGQRLYGLKGKTISVSAKLKSLGEATLGNMYIYESSGTYKVVSNTTALDTVFAINNYTCQTDDIVVAFASGNGTGVQFYDIMVNYGAKFVDYEPFTGLETTTVELNPPLRALPNGVKDTIENGVVTRRVGEITFDGSSDESWNFDTTYKYAAIDINGVTGYNIGVKNILCDKLYVINSNGSISDSTNVIRYGSSNNNNKVLYVRIDDTITSVSEFKTWLQSNHITVWYELATPTTEQITLPTLPSWYPYANIWQAQEVKANVIYGIRSNSNIGMDIVDKAINDAINKAMQDIITNAELIEVLKSYLPLTGGNITGSLTINNNVAINSRDTSNVIRSLAKITAENITALGSIYLPLQLYGNTAPAWNNGSVKKTLATLDDIPPIKKVTTTVNVHNEMDPQLLELSLPTGYTTANTTIVAFNEYSNNIKSVPTYSTANLTANNKIQISYIYTGSDTKTVTLEVTVMKSV